MEIMQMDMLRGPCASSLDGVRTKKYNSFMLYLLLAALSSAALTLVLKWFRDPKGSRYGILLGNYLTCMLIAFIQMPDKGRFYQASPSTFLLGGIGGFLFVAGLVTMQSSVRQNGATLTSAFSKLGMLIPLLMSFLFFGDVPTWLQAAGLLFAVGAIIVLNLPRKAEHASVKAEESTPEETAEHAKEEPGSRMILWLLLVTLLASGLSEGMSKVFEHLGNQTEDTRYFFFLFLTAAVLTAVLAVVEKVRHGKGIRLKEMAAGILAGIPNYFSSWFLLKALVRLPAMLVYPVFSVGSILLVTGFGALIFKERLEKRQWLGLGLILIALMLLNL